MTSQFVSTVCAVLLLPLSAFVADACSCDRLSPSMAYQNAHVVFEARISKVIGPITTGAWPAGSVKFSVSRVWKGRVAKEFEMPAVRVSGSCIGFYQSLLVRGNEVLVYAKRIAWT